MLCPNLLARIPMHCVGALLIVSAWQQVPYKNLALLFKKTDKGVKE
jgi:MFS superfamily sulfate permease-like transporter